MDFRLLFNNQYINFILIHRMIKAKDNYNYMDRNITLERQDVLKQYMLHNSKTRFSKRNTQANATHHQNNFSFLNHVKLNKGKKFRLQQERNTEIERSNRILHQKLARCARRSQPNALKTSQINSINSINLQKSRGNSRSNTKKIKTNPTLPSLQKESLNPHMSRYRQKNPTTLFMGHSKIDDVQFKIKIIIAEAIYYLIAQNEHTKIILQMPAQEYWQLHYHQFEENPCNIFKYLEIEKGQIRFRIKKEKQKQKSKEKRKKSEIDSVPKGLIKKNKGVPKSRVEMSRVQQQRLPKI